MARQRISRTLLDGFALHGARLPITDRGFLAPGERDGVERHAEAEHRQRVDGNWSGGAV